MRRKPLSKRELARLGQWVEEQLNLSPAWKVFTFGGAQWLCPYCGMAAVAASRGNVQPGDLTEHLAERCQPFPGIGADVIFPRRELHKRVITIFIKNQLRSQAAWQVRDSGNRWVCPYCTKVTEVTLKGSKVDFAVLNKIAQHVTKDCHAYDAAQPLRFHQIEDIRKSVVQAASREKITNKVMQLVNRETVWKVLTPEKRWQCPYCCEPVPWIVCESPVELQFAAPAKIAQHLMEQCPAYLSKKPPAATVQEMRRRAAGLDLTSAMPEATPFEDPIPADDPRNTRISDLNTITQVIKAVEQEVKDEVLEGVNEIERELEDARSKQLHMLPQLPEIPGWEFHVLYQPATHLAGDLYDFIDLGNRQMGVVIGDVTGHGINAALVMGITKKVINMVARLTDSPSQAMILANQELSTDLDGQTFVTLFYGILELDTGKMRFVRAGHEPLMIYNPSRQPTIQNLVPSGMAVGLTTGAAFEKMLQEDEFTIVPGDLALLYTDGLTEAQTADGAEFGRERLEAVVSGHGSQGPQPLVEQLHQTIDKLNPGAPMEDDLTLVAFRRLVT